jgi:hypothetical protein
MALKITFEDSGDVTFLVHTPGGQPMQFISLSNEQAETLMYDLMAKFGVVPSVKGAGEKSNDD